MRFLLAAILVLSFTSAQAIDVKTATDLLAKTLKDAGAIADVNNNLKIDLVKGQSMIQEAQNDLTVTKMDFDTKSGNFNAYVSSNNNLPFEVAGRFTETAKVPTLSRKFDKNEVIAKNDIVYLEIEASKLRNTYITSEDRLIGRAPTRAIFKERPISENQIADAKVMTKNKMVSLRYKDNSLTIQTAGIAMEDGTLGQSVRIKNATSNKIVRARIINDGLAEVQSTNEVASN